MPGVASAATAVVVGHVAAGTRTIRVGSGGIMLPNHSPLVIAEQFGTLESLFPGRIDLGLGRAPGTDPVTAHALRRNSRPAKRTFRATSSSCRRIWRRRSRGNSCGPYRAAARTCQSGSWARVFSARSSRRTSACRSPSRRTSRPDHLMDALALYRTPFTPSRALAAPYAMVAAGCFAADTDDEARRLFTSAQQQFMNLRRGRPGRTAAAGRIDGPVVDAGRAGGRGTRALASDCRLTRGRASRDRRLRGGDAGGRADADRADVDHDARLRSFEIAADAAR